jgi:Mechanosensitive ion channel, beta-domain
MATMLTTLEQILLVIAIAWTFVRVAESFEEVARNRLLKRHRLTLLPLLPVARRTAQILIAIFAGVAVLHSFGVNVITVLAGLGVGGIAVALSAQKTLENFIGGITLYADQPVRVGEFCRFVGTVGTVEEGRTALDEGPHARPHSRHHPERRVLEPPDRELREARPDLVSPDDPSALRDDAGPAALLVGRDSPDALCAPQGRLVIGAHPVRRLR